MLKLSHELLCEIRDLVFSERQVQASLLQKLSEVDRRRLYLEFGFPSLFEWLVKDLKFSHSAAYRRLQAVRLLRTAPELVGKMIAGEVNLTTMSQLQTAFQQKERLSGQAVPVDEKKALVEEILDKSSVQVERLLAEKFPDAAVVEENVRAVFGGRTEMTLLFSAEQMEGLNRAKEVMSSSSIPASWSDFFSKATDFFLSRKDPLRRVKERAAEKTVAVPCAAAAEVTEGVLRSHRVSLPEALKREVFRRDEGKCTYENPFTGEVCGSRFQIEIDHIIPHARGGADSLENLRCLCRGHNMMAAEKSFGTEWMDKFRKPAEPVIYIRQVK